MSICINALNQSIYCCDYVCREKVEKILRDRFRSLSSKIKEILRFDHAPKRYTFAFFDNEYTSYPKIQYQFTELPID